MSGAVRKPLEGARVLVAEDNIIAAVDIIDILRTAGAQIIGPATSVWQASQLAGTEEVSCGVLDIILHDDEIYPVARQLQHRGAGIIFVTGATDWLRIKKEWPGVEVLSKPASTIELIQAVTVACAKHNSSPFLA
jgi:DNA-binding response OmpR family regulator